MSISQKCKPIASSGLMAYLAIQTALEAIHEEDYKEAHSLSGNAIGHLYMIFRAGKISGEELEKITTPLIEAQRAYEGEDKDKMFHKLITSAVETGEFIFQKVVDCECGEAKAIEEKLGKEALDKILK